VHQLKRNTTLHLVLLDESINEDVGVEGETHRSVALIQLVTVEDPSARGRWHALLQSLQ
jgi:hypothetical protein